MTLIIPKNFIIKVGCMNSVWTVEYFQETDEFIKWFESLEEDAAESVYKELGLLETFGNMLRLPHSKALGDKLFELRERRFGYRIYYTFQGNKVIVVLAAGNKSTQEKDIKVARKRIDVLVKREVKK